MQQLDVLHGGGVVHAGAVVAVGHQRDVDGPEVEEGVDEGFLQRVVQG